MKVSTKIHVRFSDIDVMGHVNNAIYLSYFEQGRMGFFNESVGIKWDWRTNGIVLAHNEVDYLHPILLNDKPIIDTWLESVGEKSLTFMYDLNDGKGKTFARGKSVLVSYDYETQRSKTVPEQWRALVNKP
ncbi:MAG: thioesterase family protein [Bacteroidetes bacterium]|jgi:acyl-CoA thioester hydrolase|nr:thioesterase family protein [Bacteroidota bacterium]